MVRRRRFPAKLESLPEVRDFVLGEASRVGLSDARIIVLELVLEELVVNIVSYAYACPVNGPDNASDPACAPMVVPVEQTPNDAHLEVQCGSCADAQNMHAPMADAIARSGIEPADLFCVVLEDSGIAFDPLAASPPNHLGDDLETRQCGGLGIHFAKERSAVMAYERDGGKNRLGFGILRQ
jgi:anti-sigma regulatory factor (Ser/Thr protein kinase)